ncbi:CAP domain-containing protein [Gelidibacter salicanalis]|uniref:CAP domain-containing protein n=1 Tax=Gelidibacter salicanalis TaxID=291193 RepID=A0A934KVF7_9FLAO|nr:CAP domain-containing protein [Gelidibacter salicanalis]MBJ7882740.1 CAP domain-containing protein [Gelidibacter salicanalis]
MKPRLFLPILALMTLFTMSCSSEDIEEQKLDASTLITPATKTIEIGILELINAHRIGMDLQPLHNLSVIKSVAFTHTDYMISLNQVNHDNFYQRKASLVNTVAAVRVAENIAYSYTSAETVVNAWLNSPGHRATIEGDFTDFDISAEKNSEGKWYFTNIFIKR